MAATKTVKQYDPLRHLSLAAAPEPAAEKPAAEAAAEDKPEPAPVEVVVVAAEPEPPVVTIALSQPPSTAAAAAPQRQAPAVHAPSRQSRLSIQRSHAAVEPRKKPAAEAAVATTPEVAPAPAAAAAAAATPVVEVRKEEAMVFVLPVDHREFGAFCPRGVLGEMHKIPRTLLEQLGQYLVPLCPMFPELPVLPAMPAMPAMPDCAVTLEIAESQQTIARRDYNPFAMQH